MAKPEIQAQQIQEIHQLIDACDKLRSHHLAQINLLKELAVMPLPSEAQVLAAESLTLITKSILAIDTLIAWEAW